MCIAGVVYYFNCNTFELMSEFITNRKKTLGIMIVCLVCSFTLSIIGLLIRNKNPKQESYVKALEQERIQLYLKLDSLGKENDKLDSIYYESKKSEIAKEVEYTNLKTQYNILKHENKFKSTPIKQFNVAQLDSFWNENFRTGQN